MLPDRIFFTGVPGSRWSGIAQTLEQIPGMNTTDRRPDKEYTHHSYSGHKGSYFGRGMTNIVLHANALDREWADPSAGCKIVKSHEWVDWFEQIDREPMFENDWKMLVYRPDQSSFAWWHEAGGFQIKYPDYSAYENSANMLAEIIRVNSRILDYGRINNCRWEYFTSAWITENFGYQIDVDHVWPDVLVTLIKT